MSQPPDREEILQEGLEHNSNEVEKWLNYKKENETAIENLDKFIEHLNVDVMVPYGSKAFLPGKLIHTNDILVGHFQGYFSKCSAAQAKKICKYRLQIVDEHLKKLKTEEQFFENKLKKPYEEGVLPVGMEQEIIEEYDEAQEKLWREKHKLNLQKAKQIEMEELRALYKDEVEDIYQENNFNNKTEEEKNLMEELENELENIDNNVNGKCEMFEILTKTNVEEKVEEEEQKNSKEIVRNELKKGYDELKLVLEKAYKKIDEETATTENSEHDKDNKTNDIMPTLSELFDLLSAEPPAAQSAATEEEKSTKDENDLFKKMEKLELMEETAKPTEIQSETVAEKEAENEAENPKEAQTICEENDLNKKADKLENEVKKTENKTPSLFEMTFNLLDAKPPATQSATSAEVKEEIGEKENDLFKRLEELELMEDMDELPVEEETEEEETEEEETEEEEEEEEEKSVKDENDLFKRLEELELIEEMGNEFEKIEDDAPKTYEMVQNLLKSKSPPMQTNSRVSHGKQKTSVSREKNVKNFENIVEKNALKAESELSHVVNSNATTPLADAKIDQIDKKLEFKNVKATDENADHLALINEIKSIEKEYNSLLSQNGKDKYRNKKIMLYKEELKELAEDDERRRDHLTNLIVFLGMISRGVSFTDNDDDDDDDDDDDSYEVDDSEDDDEDDEDDEDNNENDMTLKDNSVAEKSDRKQQKRIRFAQDVEKLEFRDYEAVEQISAKQPNKIFDKKQNLPKTTESAQNSMQKTVDKITKKAQLLEKVEKNFEYVKENQSEHDRDLVSKIINDIENISVEKTLYIKFRHSDKIGYDFEHSCKTVTDYGDDNNEIPYCPADIYKRHAKHLNGKEQLEKTIYLDAFEGEEDVKAPLLSESKRLQSFEDPKAQFSCINNNEVLHKKSILRNKQAVELETRRKNRKEVADNENNEYMSAYNLVVGDIKPKNLNKPEPLPDAKFVDAHAPKKRISHFKHKRIIDKANKNYN